MGAGVTEASPDSYRKSQLEGRGTTGSSGGYRGGGQGALGGNGFGPVLKGGPREGGILWPVGQKIWAGGMKTYTY